MRVMVSELLNPSEIRSDGTGPQAFVVDKASEVLEPIERAEFLIYVTIFFIM